MRTIQGHSWVYQGWSHTAGQCANSAQMVWVPSSQRHTHPITKSGLIAGEKMHKKEHKRYSSPRLDPMSNEQREEYQDVSKPRKVNNMSKWKNIQDVIYWINLRKAQDKGLKLWKTCCNASILYDPVPADCIERMVNTKTKEILYQKASTPRPPSKIFWGKHGRSNVTIPISMVPDRIAILAHHHWVQIPYRTSNAPHAQIFVSSLPWLFVAHVQQHASAMWHERTNNRQDTAVL